MGEKALLPSDRLDTIIGMSKKRRATDPEEQRWQRRFPRYPGLGTCVELLANRNVKGTWVDIICDEIGAHASEEAVALFEVTRREANLNSRVGRILIGVIAESAPPGADEFLVELLHSSEDETREGVANALRQLGTKTARTALWEHSQRHQR